MRVLYDDLGNPIILPNDLSPPNQTPTPLGMGITPLSELKAYTQGVLIALPEFGPGQPFKAMLKRPSITILMKSGRIPNSLMKTANQLFSGEVEVNEENSDGLKQLFDVFDIICESAFVSPTFAQLKGEGITLTDEQYMFVFNYTQLGVKALTPFHSESQGNGPDSNVTAISSETINSSSHS